MSSSSSNPQVALIFNPKANKGKAHSSLPSVLNVLYEIYGKDHVKCFQTKGPGDGITCTQQAIRDNYNLIIAAGGDGTINECLNGMMDPKTEQCGAQLGIIPLGTGCDFGRMFGISEKTWPQVLKGNHSMHVDAIHVSSTHDILSEDNKVLRVEKMQRYCMNEVSFGLSGLVVRNMNAKKKHWISKQASYNWEAVYNYLVLKNKEVVFELQSDNEENDSKSASSNNAKKTRSINQALCVCSNGSFFGVNMNVAPSADPVSGSLTTTIFENIGFLDVFRILYALRSTGVTATKKIHIRKSKALHAEPKNPEDKIYIEMDGEVFGRLPVDVRKIARCVNVIVPKRCVDAIEKRGIAPHPVTQSETHQEQQPVEAPKTLVDVDVTDEQKGETVLVEKPTEEVPSSLTNTTTVAPTQNNEDKPIVESEVILEEKYNSVEQPAENSKDKEETKQNDSAADAEANDSTTQDHQEDATTTQEETPVPSTDEVKQEEVADSNDQEADEEPGVDAQMDSVSEQEDNTENKNIDEPEQAVEDNETEKQEESAIESEKKDSPKKVESLEKEVTTAAVDSTLQNGNDASTADTDDQEKKKPQGDVKECSICHMNKEKADYSKNQWKKKDERKCKVCVANQ